MTSTQLRTSGAIVLVASLLLARVFVKSPTTQVDRATTVNSQTMSSFELRDAFGNLYSSQELLGEHRLVLFVFLGCECPLVRLYADRLEELARRFAEQGVAVVGINSNAQDPPTKIARFVRETGVTFPILKDPQSRIADDFGATRTPEAFLVSSAGQVLYRGRIDDQFGVGYRRPSIDNAYVEDAIVNALAEKPVSTFKTDPMGCLIGRVPERDDSKDESDSTDAITYTRHVSELLNRRCVECHRDGEVAPFPLTSYDEVVGWAPMIREVVESGRMPPWGADPSAGEFKNDPRLTDAERNELFQWIDQGCPQGSGPAAAMPHFSEGWSISEPDAVYYISESDVAVEAFGPIPYKTFFVPLQFNEDKWVRAAELRPGNRRVVHHANAWVLGPDEPDDDYSRPPPFTFAPGTPPLRCPDGYAVRVPAGSRLRMQLHYEPIGTPAVDRTALGLVFADGKDVRGQIVFDSVLPSRPLRIPAGDADAAVNGSVHFAREGKLLAFLPHMHLRGKSMRFDLHVPGASPKPLLAVPRYDFNWQLVYYLKEPLLVRPGSELRCSAVFDNSTGNPNNPDPSRAVPWGPATTDEMMVGYLIGVDPQSERPNSSQYVFPMEGFGAPLDRAWRLEGGNAAHARILDPSDPEEHVRVQQSQSPADSAVSLVRTVVPVTRGQAYTFSFRAKGDGHGKISVRVVDRTTGMSLGCDESISVEPRWSHHRFEIAASSSSAEPQLKFDIDATITDLELAQVSFLQGSHR